MAAESDQGGTESVGVDLRGEDDGPLGVDGESVRGPALRPGGSARPRVDTDQAQRLQLGGYGPRGRPRHTEFGGEHGAGGRAPGVHERERGTEGTAAPLQPCPSLGHSPILTLCRA